METAGHYNSLSWATSDEAHDVMVSSRFQIVTLFPVFSQQPGMFARASGQLVTMACALAQPRMAAVARDSQYWGGGHDWPGRDTAVMTPRHIQPHFTLIQTIHNDLTSPKTRLFSISFWNQLKDQR